ncbi:MAG TPA: PAS domain S-box protein, partial [Candidatus Marinimicrobia bacterium]|nr:PAS domain S-box protein [Candidatus Neomarinimicrobiota bacterium]
INQACLDLFGIDDISYIKDYNLFDDPQLTNEQKETIRAGRQLRFEAPFDFGKVTAYPTRHSGISWFRVVFSNLSGPTPGYMMQIEDITLQKKAEAALVESEKRYRLITENTSDIIWVMDVESGRFLYVSPSVERLRGYTVEEVMAEPAFEALTPESREKLNELIPKYVAEFLSGISKIYIDEIEQSRKDGTTVWTETSTRYVNDELTGKLIVYGVSRDISERKAAEAKMRVHELQFQRIIENLPNMLLIFNPDFDILYINRKGLELLRIKQNEVQTLNLLKDGILPADLIDSCQKELLQTGVLTDKELSITNPAGQKFWTLFSSLSINYQEKEAYLATLQDISYRKLMEDAILESEEKFRILAENSSAGIFIVYNGLFIYINQGLAEILGYSPKELIKKEAKDYIHSDYRKIVQSRAEARLNGEDVPAQYEIKVLTKNGETRWCELRAATIRLNNRLVNMGTLFDITDRKRSARALLEANEKLEKTLEVLQETQEKMLRQERLTAVGQVSAGIAHDFNNILSAILGFSDLLEFATEAQSPNMELIQQIKQSGQRAAKLVQQLLDFTSKGIRRPKPMNFTFFLKDSLPEIRALMNDDISVELSILEDDIEIEADTEQWQQIIANISSNAADAMPNGGRFLIMSEKVHNSQDISCSICQQPIDGEWLRVSFTDTGEGIKPELLRRVFEPFFTTKAIGRGTGLGLSQVLGIVSQYHGHIIIESEPG